MSESARMVTVLTLIAVISGGSLAVVDIFTAPRIAENRVKALNEGLRRLIPEAVEFQQIDVSVGEKNYIVFKGTRDDILVGWGFLLSGSGFQDKISIVAAADPTISKLLGLEVLEQKETPGLGANITKDAFRAQFRGLSLERDIGYVKNIRPEPGSNNIQAISAATISSKKLLAILNDNISKLRDSGALKDGGEVAQ